MSEPRIFHQFDVFRQPDRSYVLNLRNDVLDGLPVLPVALLEPAEGRYTAIRGLQPVLTVGEVRLRLAPHFLVTLALPEVGPTIANLAHERDEIIRALDLLLTGV
ncbi:CcdB family protein [Histidinibacterium aquaticum]|uniref:Toxin CcdB n=1 Tax=Histidinibacterium aquaticum TaxID=2613962 RepID=A0A5J5GMF5_9RHOB|nr:CcdB family protein [Histidinibacterium aquaticum]KAA9009227.1 hypothetical protein F3S47_08210 [Histidinibacterium aquaticum]